MIRLVLSLPYFLSANVVEKLLDFVQSILQSEGDVNVELPDHGFDAAKEALDPPIEPGGTNRNGLFTHSGQLQKRSKQPAVEHGHVVGTDGTGFAILANGKAQMLDQLPVACVA